MKAILLAGGKGTRLRPLTLHTPKPVVPIFDRAFLHYQIDLVQSWMVAVIIGRELAVTTLRSIAYARGVVIPASPLGKVKMVAQVVAILALILGEEERLQPLGTLGSVALWVVVATALISAADYYRRFSRIPSKVASFPPVEQPRTKAS